MGRKRVNTKIVKTVIVRCYEREERGLNELLRKGKGFKNG